jgi:hypothetical protein
MRAWISLAAVVCAALITSGCATPPLSQRAFGHALPVAKDATGDRLALVTFSGDRKYETEKGVPLYGDPVVCGRDGAYRVNEGGGSARKDQLAVKAGEEVVVTSVIQWNNAGWVKTCWPFVAFTPEREAKYVVVNERIGGKGMAGLFTGVAFQTCEVSVYRETPSGFEPVKTSEANIRICRLQAQKP